MIKHWGVVPAAGFVRLSIWSHEGLHVLVSISPEEAIKLGSALIEYGNVAKREEENEE